ncbi:MAG: hypothetical protein CL608_07825 [Anaerolineaceae bacterium]|nr:hypothetical protein [Anaerolineaceae bacterium]
MQDSKPPAKQQEETNALALVDYILMVLGFTFILLAIGLLTYMLRNDQWPRALASTNSEETYEGELILHVPANATQIEALAFSSQLPVVVMFDADWCPYCRQLRPRLEREILSQEGEVVLVYVDIDDCPVLQNKYAARSVPTVVAFVDNQEVKRFVGAHSQSYVRDFVADLLPAK